MAAVRSGHGRCADLESRLLSGERWIYVDQQSLRQDTPSELARRARQYHERITLTRNGEPEAVLLSVNDLESLEMTLEILGDTEAVARVSESLAALERREPGAGMDTVRQDLARRRVTGA